VKKKYKNFGIVNFILAMLLSLPSFGQECTKAVEFVKAGSTVSCNGYLFSKQKEIEVRFKVKTYDILIEQLKVQDDINNALEKRLVNTQEYNEYLSIRLQQENKTSFWSSALYFSLGAVLTGVIASNVR